MPSRAKPRGRKRGASAKEEEKKAVESNGEEHEDPAEPEDIQDDPPTGENRDILASLAALRSNSNQRLSVPPYEGSSYSSVANWLGLVDMAHRGATDEAKISACILACANAPPEVTNRLIGLTEGERSVWKQFKRAMLGPEEADQVLQDFEALRQDDLTVNAYEAAFTVVLRRLQSIYPEYASDTIVKMKFARGLREDLRIHCASQEFKTYKDLAAVARRIEQALGGSKRLKTEATPSRTAGSLAPLAEASLPSAVSAHAGRLLLLKPGDQQYIHEQAELLGYSSLSVFAELDKMGGKCFRCGENGHWQSACTVPARNTQHNEMQNPLVQRNPETNFSPCRDWANGFCMRGKTCKFQHASELDRRCYGWTNGNCRYGRECKFSHDTQQSPSWAGPNNHSNGLDAALRSREPFGVGNTTSRPELGKDARNGAPFGGLGNSRQGQGRGRGRNNRGPPRGESQGGARGSRMQPHPDRRGRF